MGFQGITVSARRRQGAEVHGLSTIEQMRQQHVGGQRI